MKITWSDRAVADLTEIRRVVYRRQAERVEIVLVIHGRRDLAGMEPKPWQR